MSIDETVITDEIIQCMTEMLTHSKKQFRKVCFVGTDRAAKKQLKRALDGNGLMLAFINDFEKAKEWLI